MLPQYHRSSHPSDHVILTVQKQWFQTHRAPASKKPKTYQTEGTKTIYNWLLTLKTRRAKCKRSLQVLREHAKNSTCPYGLQYRLRPHIPVVQFDREFQTNLDQNGRLANAELLMLKIKQQKKNLHVYVTANNEAIQAQQQLLQDLYPHWSAEFPGNQKLCCQQKGWRMVFTSIREHAEHWDFFASTSRDKKLIFLCE